MESRSFEGTLDAGPKPGSKAARPETGSSIGQGAAVWRGLLWYEWYANSRALLLFLIAWLVVVWGLPLLGHPGWILAFGLAFAFYAGPAFGGGDVLEGCEEFSFGLPPTRSERFSAKLLLGGGALLMFTLADLLALGLDLSQALARLYLDTGLMQPLQVARPGLLYGLVFTMPFTVFACSFTWSILTRSRAQVLTAWLWGGLAALLTLRAGLFLEHFLWGHMNGAIACSLLMSVSAGALLVGWRVYRRKEVGPPASPLQLPVNGWAWIVVFLLALTLAGFLVNWLFGEARTFFASAVGI